MKIEIPFRRVLIAVVLCFMVLTILRAATPERSTSDNKTATVAKAQPAIHAVVTRTPPTPRRIATGATNAKGEPVTLDCAACHGVRKANRQTSRSDELNEFHQGLMFQHGKLTCVACHQEQDGYSSLHLADGTKVEYADSMTLCAQCHGPQFRDYTHGSHGGMNGHWDLTRGGRTRNHCLHCHDSHSPSIPQVIPAPAPRDRFSPASKRSSHD